MFKRIFIIINPASGREEPVLSYINKALKKKNIYWEVAITKQKNDAYELAKDALSKRFDLIAVYGGDGTVMEVAQALYLKKMPLLILPGGTANVMAKEIGIPMETRLAVNLLKGKRIKLRRVDMALLGKTPFILRINVGILADMVKNTNQKSKERFGRLAYSASAMRQLIKHDIYSFKMNLDGKEIQDEGVALMVANAGNIGISDFSVLPHVGVADGNLDVVLFKVANVRSFANWVRSTIRNEKPKGSIRHWKAKKAVISFSPQTQIICDDNPVTVSKIEAKIVPQALTLVVP